MGNMVNQKRKTEMTPKKLTIEDIQSKIESAIYMQPAGTTVTLAILTLSNGYSVTGESACLNPADFDAEMGKKIAYENAEEKIWVLEGYLRKENAFAGKKSSLPVVAIPPHHDLKSFIGTKIVNAKPMNRGLYNQLRGWELPSDENALDDGYLVEYTDAQRPNVSAFKGYISWSPKEVFESSYSEFNSTAHQDQGGGEILGDGVRFKNQEDPAPLPFGG